MSPYATDRTLRVLDGRREAFHARPGSHSRERRSPSDSSGSAPAPPRRLNAKKRISSSTSPICLGSRCRMSRSFESAAAFSQAMARYLRFDRRSDPRALARRPHPAGQSRSGRPSGRRASATLVGRYVRDVLRAARRCLDRVAPIAKAPPGKPTRSILPSADTFSPPIRLFTILKAAASARFTC